MVTQNWLKKNLKKAGYLFFTPVLRIDFIIKLFKNIKNEKVTRYFSYRRFCSLQQRK